LAPFSPSEEAIQNEEVRLKYRYVDLRRLEMQRNFRLRHDITLAVRESLSAQGFLEIETPILTKSTPEGARDFLVPSRVHPGEFYALPQSPQIFKQILMISGFDRYFQIARCFRDEDCAPIASLSFTQVDLEMSFPRQETVFGVVEHFLTAAFRSAGVTLPTPFPRITYDDAMRQFGSDKPDMRLPGLPMCARLHRCGSRDAADRSGTAGGRLPHSDRGRAEPQGTRGQPSAFDQKKAPSSLMTSSVSPKAFQTLSPRCARSLERPKPTS